MGRKKQKGFNVANYYYIKSLMMGEPDGYVHGKVYYRSGDGKKGEAPEVIKSSESRQQS